MIITSKLLENFTIGLTNSNWRLSYLINFLIFSQIITFLINSNNSLWFLAEKIYPSVIILFETCKNATGGLPYMTKSS